MNRCEDYPCCGHGEGFCPGYTPIDEGNFAITGNTYPHRERLRALGCTWHKGRKAWIARDSQMAAIGRSIVAGKGGCSPQQPSQRDFIRDPGEDAADRWNGSQGGGW